MNEIKLVIQEMRERRINHGKSTSPTLEAWANRLEAAIAVPSEGVEVAYQSFLLSSKDRRAALEDAIIAALPAILREPVAIIGECAEVQWQQEGPWQLPPGAVLYSPRLGGVE